MNNCPRNLKPEEIAIEFDISEHDVWRKLESGEWQALTLCDWFDSDDSHSRFERACISAEVVRLLIAKPGQEIVYTTEYGQHRIVAAGKEHITVFVSPEFTPELYCGTARQVEQPCSVPSHVSESPEERLERIKKRHAALKEKGCRNPTQTVAKEEGCDDSRIRQLLRKEGKQTKGLFSMSIEQVRKR